VSDWRTRQDYWFSGILFAAATALGSLIAADGPWWAYGGLIAAMLGAAALVTWFIRPPPSSRMDE
jgi:hypothetical protein